MSPTGHDDEPASRARRSAMSPGEDDDDDAVVPRRSALSPIPSDDAPVVAPRRSAFTPTEPEVEPAPRRSGWVEDDEDEDDGYEETLRLPMPRRSSEYAVAARAIQPALPDLGPTAGSAPSPVELSPDEPSSPVTAAASPFSPSVQPALPDPALSGPVEAAFSNTELLPVVPPTVEPISAFAAEPARAPQELPVAAPAPAPVMTPAVSPVSTGDRTPTVEPVSTVAPVTTVEPVSTVAPVMTPLLPSATASFAPTYPHAVEPAPAAVAEPPIHLSVPPSTMAAAAVAAEVVAIPAIAEVPAALADEQALRAEEAEMVNEGGLPIDPDASDVGDVTATWLFGSAFSDADHSLYKRPAPGEPETEVDLTPIVIDDPEYDVRKGTKPLAKSSPRPSRTTSTKPTRGRSARRVHLAWRDHRRLLTISAIVLALLLVVGVGGYLLSRFNPTMAAITEGKLSLPSTAGVFQRDPAQGATPSIDPASKIQTVSATYSLDGTQEFVAIAYRPQTDASAALTEIQASGVVKVNGGACGRTTDQNRMACAVVSGTTAVLLVTLVDQSTDELIAAAQSVSAGIGKT